MLAAFTLLSGCARGQDVSSGAEQIRMHWETMEQAKFDVEILSDLGQSTLAYKLSYDYNKEGNDSFMITAPEPLSGITATIVGDDTTALTLQYEGTVLDAPGPSKAGVTPADAVPYLLNELRTGVPTESFTETVDETKLTVLVFERGQGSDSTTRQIWLNGNVPTHAEVYMQEERVLTLTFSNWG